MIKITMPSTSTEEEIELKMMELLITSDEDTILIIDETGNIIKKI